MLRKESTKFSKMKKLIILEGPSGSGKTTFCNGLAEMLSFSDLKCKILEEFSSSMIGKTLRENVKYGTDQGDWLKGLGGMLVFLGDKMAQIEKELVSEFDIIIADRFLLTQFVLGIEQIYGKRSQQCGKDIINECCQLVFGLIQYEVLIVLLECDIEILKNRLTKRIERKLSMDEMDSLTMQSINYGKLKNIQWNVPVLEVLNENKMDQVLNHIYKKVVLECQIQTR